MKTLAYRPDIDGLRAIAVLTVVGFHAFPNFIRGGFVGVDVFFVISGYLITTILLRENHQGTFSVATFYARRIKRIVPALLIVLGCSMAFGWYVLLSNEFRQFGRHTAGGALFVSNFVLWQEAGYFDNAAESKPLLHLWSLAIEEQFYIVLPLALAWSWRWHLTPVRLLLGMALLSLGFNVVLIDGDRAGAFFSPLTRIWELLAGSLLASFELRHRFAAASDGLATVAVHASTRRREAMAVVGMLLVTVGALGYDRTLAYPGAWAIVPVAGALLLISAGPVTVVNRLVLSHPMLVAIGLISYPLYLWHWPLLKFSVMANDELLSWMTRLALVAASMVLAWLTYRFVERPIRADVGRRTVVGLAIGLVGIGVIGASAAAGLFPSRHRAEGLERIVSATVDWQFPSASFHSLYYEGRRFFTQRTPHEETVLFIGDSNVEQYGPRVSAVLSGDPRRHKSVVFATKGGCLPVPMLVVPTPGCPDHIASALRYARSPQIDTVVLGGHWLNLPEGPVRAQALQDLASMIRELSSTKKVYLVLNIPAGPEFDPHSMFTGSRLSTLEPRASPAQFQLAPFLATYQELRTALRAIGEANRATVIDPIERLCRDGVCAVLSDDGRPLYRDDHHMRPFHAERDADYIDATVAWRKPRDAATHPLFPAPASASGLVPTLEPR